MNNPTINFKCPKCEFDVLTRIRHEITARDHLEGFFVQTEKTPGRKYGVMVGFTGNSEGKAKKFECGRCGYVLMTEPRETAFLRVVRQGSKPKPKPITTLSGVYQWLKRHNMIEESLA